MENTASSKLPPLPLSLFSLLKKITSTFPANDLLRLLSCWLLWFNLCEVAANIPSILESCINLPATQREEHKRLLKRSSSSIMNCDNPLRRCACLSTLSWVQTRSSVVRLMTHLATSRCKRCIFMIYIYSLLFVIQLLHLLVFACVSDRDHRAFIWESHRHQWTTDNVWHLSTPPLPLVWTVDPTAGWLQGGNKFNGCLYDWHGFITLCR